MSVQSLLKRLSQTPLKEIDGRLEALKRERDAVIARYDAEANLLTHVRHLLAGNGAGAAGNGADPTVPGPTLIDRVRVYLEKHGTATPGKIAEDLGLERAQVQPVLYRRKDLFRQVAEGWKLR